MATINEVAVKSARPLPVILLADASGSMTAGGKINVLNTAIEEMFRIFANEDDFRAEIHVAVITFGGSTARLHMPLAPAGLAHWAPISAEGKTPLGAALKMVKGLIEDRDLIPARAYRPTLVLVSDGEPTDAWKDALGELKASERAAKAMRMALAVGADANVGMLEAFVEGSGVPVFRASDVPHIAKFFRLVTMTVMARTQSTQPNSVPPVPTAPLEELDF